MIARYRKRPVEIVALLHDGFNTSECREFLGKSGKLKILSGGRTQLWVKTPEGKAICRVGDYIVRGSGGEFYPCDPGVFEKNYEEVTENKIPPQHHYL